MASSKSRSSPKKKRSKRKAVDSDGDANSAKKMRAGAEIQQPEFVDHTLAATRRSGRAGAGTGGRAAQLEKIGALLDASHTRSAQRKGTTSLDLNTPANPLAPEQPRKGRGSHSKKPHPPPPYSPPETTNPASSRKPVKKPKATKKDTAPASTGSEVVNHQPSFSHRKPGARFGFGQSLMPPGTEPHRQVLNPSPAAAKKQRTCLPSDPTGHPPAVASTCPTPKAPTTSMSVVRQTSAHLYKNLDPVLWPTADVQGAASEGSDSQDGDG
ncbi:hypothetical protein P692DRAFT_20883670, partial [Suillus brevipes Sb2]